MSDDLYVSDTGRLAPVAGRPYQILSLSGGGYRGLYSAALLEALEERAGRPLGQIFDLIAGTSIGGILAIGLAAGVPASKLRKAFEEHGDHIFPAFYRLFGRKVFPRLRTGLLRRRYSAAGLKETIEAILTHAGGKSRLRDLETPLLAISVDVTTRQARLFETGQGDQDVSLLDICLATSAAPGFFPEHVIGQSGLVDGGLIANAPDTVAIVRALGLRRRIEDIHMLSIGTVGASDAGVPRKASGAGLLLRGKDLFLLTLSAHQNLSVELASDALSGRYVRLDAAPSAIQTRALGLDRSGRAAQDTLRLLAAQTIARADDQHAAYLRLLLNRSRAK